MAEVKRLSKIKISNLVPYENNAKIHGPEQIKKLQKSIEQFGFLSPILIDKDKRVIKKDILYNEIEDYVKRL